MISRASVGVLIIYGIAVFGLGGVIIIGCWGRGAPGKEEDGEQAG